MLFSIKIKEEVDHYEDCDTTWLFAVKVDSKIVAVETYDNYYLSWLFPPTNKHDLSWMDKIKEKFEIPNIVKLCDYFLEKETSVKYDNLEDVIFETASDNGNTTEIFYYTFFFIHLGFNFLHFFNFLNFYNTPKIIKIKLLTNE